MQNSPQPVIKLLAIPVYLEERLPVHLGDGLEEGSGEDDLCDVVGDAVGDGKVGRRAEVGAPQSGHIHDPLDHVQVKLVRRGHNQYGLFGIPWKF